MNKNMTRLPVVYGLRAGDFFGYVGMTRVNAKTRLWEHRSRARQGHSAPVYDWIRSVGIENLEIEILDSSIENESTWILKLINEGHPIANQQARDGVERSMSAESKERIGAPKRGRDTWIKGLHGEAAGWTAERKMAQSIAMKNRMMKKSN